MGGSLVKGLFGMQGERIEVRFDERFRSVFGSRTSGSFPL